MCGDVFGNRDGLRAALRQPHAFADDRLERRIVQTGQKALHPFQRRQLLQNAKHVHQKARAHHVDREPRDVWLDLVERHRLAEARRDTFI